MIEARVELSSVSANAPRLTTFVLQYPKFIHGEVMTHRAFSRNASSSRAIPVSKNLEETRNDELRAAPVWWGREQKGMQSGDELDAYEKGSVEFYWQYAAKQAAYAAENMRSLGAHKSIVNRILEPFLHINVVLTSCEPGLMNFFGLRLEKAAQPEIRVLAEKMWAAYNENKPQTRKIGEWHLPFVNMGEVFEQTAKRGEQKRLTDFEVPIAISNSICVSVARCARVSYFSYATGKRSTIDEDLALYDKLVGMQPLHASPAEHQATPDTMKNNPKDWQIPWNNWQQAGNLGYGWRQYRKMLLGEDCAPLPEAYR